MQLRTLPGTPRWNDGREQRLFVSMFLATFIVAGILSVIRAPVIPVWSPVVELLVRIVQEYLDSQIETYGYFHPDVADKRRRLSERYQPRTHPAPKPIWENIEKDTLGRSVLRDGDCFKVLDDPNVGSREAFEMFGQYMAVCTYQKRNPKNLPWVADIVQRYEYLRDPDGYVKGEE